MTTAYAWHSKVPYLISTTVADFDFGRVHNWLSNAYWSEGIPRETVEKAFANSLNFGLFHEVDGQVGCARMITDRATFAYLADVFIDDSCRGHGLGRWMMDVIMAHPDLQGLRRQMLATRDMHKLYAQVGFKPIANPGIFMEVNVPDIYRPKNAQ